MLVRSLAVLVAAPALALSSLVETAVGASSSVEEGAVPQVSAAPTAAKSATKKELSYAEEFEQELKRCVDSWDAGTNMSKSQWRQVCRRTLEHRLPYKRGSGGGRP